MLGYEDANSENRRMAYACRRILAYSFFEEDDY